jgi:polyisoprenoid-binding protein YceI
VDGTYGPHNATLTVRTGRAGAAAKAGHDLLIEVTRWEGTVRGDEVTVTVDPRSLAVREGTGGVMPLSDDDHRNIEQTIDDEVLRGQPIEYSDGQLTLNGQTHPLAVERTETGGRATIRQTEWGMKPYTALFGTLKVADEVTVEATLRE